MSDHADRMRPVFVETQYPIAFDSPDHLAPWGTMRDNSTNGGYIGEMLSYFGHPIAVLDIGCSGGLLIHDFHNQGNMAVGIEGSDYSARNGRAQWPELFNKNLFTCDASREYAIKFSDTKETVAFDLISAWEVIEHIHPDRLDIFFENIKHHLKPDGIFVGSISTVGDGSSGMELHQSLFSQQEWMDAILPKHFNVTPYPFQHRVRTETGSFYIMLQHK